MIDPKIEECITHGGAGHRLAQIFVLLHGEVFVCTNSTARTIYHFKDHRWTESGIGAINLLLSDTVYTAFVDKAASIGRSLANSTGDQNATQKKRYEICNKIALKLLDPRFKSSLLTEICHMLEDRKFFEKLDTKAHLVGFDNGVFDLEDELFRPGQPEDFVSFSCGYDYAYVDDETVQTEIMSFIESCFDDHDTCLYVLSAYAACVYGYRKFEEFYIQTGALYDTASRSCDARLVHCFLRISNRSCYNYICGFLTLFLMQEREQTVSTVLQQVVNRVGNNENVVLWSCPEVFKARQGVCHCR